MEKEINQKNVDKKENNINDAMCLLKTKEHLINPYLLAEIGIQYGSRSCFLNSKMKPYIYTKKGDTHIINLESIILSLNKAFFFLLNLLTQKPNANVLYVGPRSVISKYVVEQANRVNASYVNTRWLGGTLTNFPIIHKRIRKLIETELKEKEGNLYFNNKKDLTIYKKEKKVLLNNLSGLVKMHELPDVLIVMNSKNDRTAINEAIKLNIPIISVVDTDSSPEGINYPIYANSKHIKSLYLILTLLTDAIAYTKKQELVYAFKNEINFPENLVANRPSYFKFNNRNKFNKSYKYNSNFNKNK